jgi:hypothetical protein
MKKIFSLIVLICLYGCEPLNLNGDIKVINPSKVDEVSVDINMQKGNLFLSAGRHDFAAMKFDYPIQTRRAEVQYLKEDQRGLLTVHEKPFITVGTFPKSDRLNQWKILLGQQFPFRLNVELNEGRAQINLCGMNIQSVSLNLGSGDVVQNYVCSWNKNLYSDIQVEDGHLTLNLPADTGVYIEAEEGSNVDAGSLNKKENIYTNELYQTGKTFLKFRVRTKGGRIKVNLQ